MPKNIKHVVIFSGINNLILPYLSDKQSSSIYNSFYLQSVYEKLMSGRFNNKNLLKQLLKNYWLKFTFRTSNKVKKVLDQESFANVVKAYNRDLNLWKLLSAAMGFNVYFVFQPVASWINKQFTKEEKELFSILDMRDSWKPIAEYMTLYKDNYRNEVNSLCLNNNISFTDFNTLADYTTNTWLFVDRVHLTNSGYEVSAKYIQRIIK